MEWGVGQLANQITLLVVVWIFSGTTLFLLNINMKMIKGFNLK